MLTDHADEAFHPVFRTAEAQAIERDMRRIDRMFLESTYRPVDLASMGLTRGTRAGVTIRCCRTHGKTLARVSDESSL